MRSSGCKVDAPASDRMIPQEEVCPPSSPCYSPQGGSVVEVTASLIFLGGWAGACVGEGREAGDCAPGPG